MLAALERHAVAAQFGPALASALGVGRKVADVRAVRAATAIGAALVGGPLVGSVARPLEVGANVALSAVVAARAPLTMAAVGLAIVFFQRRADGGSPSSATARRREWTRRHGRGRRVR